ncbi:MAG: DUF1571 domain-containing protein [Gemmataceae bacterium]|nr:DUF1571 domain-containing protein [Gemmataceae bacterium]MDW8263702.1 DUF1571 domain-containing protein [Gemmataceae bacterium]
MARGRAAWWLAAALLVGAVAGGCVYHRGLLGSRSESLPTSRETPAAAPLLPPVVPATESSRPAPRSPASVESIAQAPEARPGGGVPGRLTSNPSAPLPAVNPDPQADPIATIRELHRRAVESYAQIDSYIARLRRQEVVGNTQKPEEILLFRFRKQPHSVYLKWIGEEGRGREVTFVRGQHGNKIHTLTVANDIPFLPGGRRIALAPDSLVVRSASRHSIDEAGIGHIIDQLGRILDAVNRNDPRAARLKYLGFVTRPEYDAPLEGVEVVLPPGAEPTLPRGGRRLCFFDPRHRLPVLLVTYDESGRQVEYYCYDRLQYPVRLDDDDFDPNKLWGRSPAQ